MYYNAPFASFLCNACYIALTILIFTPLEIYFTVQFWRTKHSLIVKKRYPQITICLCVLVLLDEYLTRIPWALFRAGYVDMFAIQIHMMYKPFSSVAIAYALSLKIWLMWYDVNWYHQNCTNQWQSIINSKSSQMKRNSWFVRNRYKYGRIRYLFKRIMFVLVIIVTVSYIFAIGMNWKLRILCIFYTFALENIQSVCI